MANPTDDRRPPHPTFLSDLQWHRVVQRLQLSPREAEIAAYLMNGKKEPTIADTLDISEHTVHSHVRRLYGKLGVHDRLAMITRIFEATVRATGSSASESGG